MTTLQDKFKAMMNEIGQEVLEREHAIEMSTLALLVGEHVIFIGPPGVAKSKLCRAFCKRIVDTEYFEKLLTQFTTPEEVFGPIDLVKLERNGTYQRISDGALTSAHIGFLDEVYKANSAVLNSLLTIINERLLHEVGFKPRKVPLLSLFGASNEIPEGTELRAFYDRFLVKLIASNCVEEESFEKLVACRIPSTADATITLDDMNAARQEVASVKISKAAMAAMKKLKQLLDNEGVEVSDRKWYQCGMFLKAAAWLDGRAMIEVEDVEVLTAVLWMDPKEIRTVERIVFSVANPLHLRAIELEDRAREVYEKRPTEGSTDFQNRLENVVQQLTDIAMELKKDIESSKTKRTKRAHEALNLIMAWHRDVAKVVLEKVQRMTLAL